MARARGLEPLRRFSPSSAPIIMQINAFITLLTLQDVTPHRYPEISSIHRDGDKPNWFCCFYDPEGFRRKRSSGTNNAKIARTICAAIEHASTLTRQGKLSNEKALKLVRETLADIGEAHGKLAGDRAENVLKSAIEEFIKICGGEFTSYTIKSWLESWAAGRTDASKATQIEYKRIAELFLKFLGKRGDRALTPLQQRQIEDFKTTQSARVSASSVNKCLKVLKAAFNAAVKSRQLEFNPAQHVEFIQTERIGRRPFTDKELKELLSHADSNWRTMILLAFYTGLRLRDCAYLTWRNVELHTRTLNVLTQKTGRRQVLPIADPLARHLSELAGMILMPRFARH